MASCAEQNELVLEEKNWYVDLDLQVVKWNVKCA